MKDSANRGQSDVIVSKFDIISSSGKKLSELVGTKGWNTIKYSESMGLLQGDTQFISGEVTIIDEVNIFNEMNLVGDEIIELKFETPQKKEIDFVGRIYNVDIIQPNNDQRVLLIKFCSAEKIVSDQIKITRAYREVPYSVMAKDIFTPLNAISGKKIYAEPTKNIGSLIINNKSPIDALNMITRVSRSAKYMGSNYVFFEKSDGVFQFRSIESMVDPVEVSPVITYCMEVSTGEKNNLKNLVGIKAFKIITLPNTVRAVQSGMYGSTIVSNDLMKRRIDYNTFNYDETFQNFKSLNFNTVSGGHGKTTLTNNKTYSERNSSVVQFLPKHFGSFDTETNHADEREDTSLIRASQMQQINAIRLQLMVSGDSQRRIGEVVNVELPPPATKKTAGRMDEILSGRYLISKIKHLLYSDKSGYTTVLLLVKDSYSNPLPKKA